MRAGSGAAPAPPALPPPGPLTACVGFLPEVKERVRKEEERGVTAAAALFLDAVLLLEAEGWLRGFLDALVAAGGRRSGRFAAAGQGRHRGARSIPPGLIPQEKAG